MTTPQVTRIADAIDNGLKDGPLLGGNLLLDFGDDGRVYIEGRGQPLRTTASEPQGFAPDCTVSIDLDTFKRMIAGEVDAAAIYMQGKLKIAGDLRLALKLGPALQLAREARQTSK